MASGPLEFLKRRIEGLKNKVEVSDQEARATLPAVLSSDTASSTHEHSNLIFPEIDMGWEKRFRGSPHMISYLVEEGDLRGLQKIIPSLASRPNGSKVRDAINAILPVRGAPVVGVHFDRQLLDKVRMHVPLGGYFNGEHAIIVELEDHLERGADRFLAVIKAGKLQIGNGIVRIEPDQVPQSQKLAA